MSQTNLGDFSDGEPVDKDFGVNRRRTALKHADSDAEPYDDLSCPWCLAPKDEFETREEDGKRTVSCGKCTAVIPVEADWYLRGKKIHEL